MQLQRLAPAKVNLFLHVGRLRADGYHPVCSLATFADVGDVVRLAPAEAMGFSVDGPFAASLAGEADNLVTRARDLLLAGHAERAPFRLTLDKRLPIAAGLGGGSSDAAAALRLIGEAFAGNGSTAMTSTTLALAERPAGRRHGDVPGRPAGAGGGPWRRTAPAAGVSRAAGRAGQPAGPVADQRGLRRL